ncbi:MAG TPA: glycosyl hydrolase family 39 [Candidatus Dormibacteraeota bacterium]|nr:glycosyl hydrolase family 39 [Candidatus Dormibacteraeota bacterium]
MTQKATPPQAAGNNVTIRVDPNAPSHPFPHFWEQMFGSGRAVLSLRADYRQDLREVKGATNFKYIRFHGIFDHDVGLYSEDAAGNPVYNFSYVDHIYDGLLDNGVRPFVELSFMPRQLAASPIEQAFWYHPIVSPPKDWSKWGALITNFARHLVDRYGIDEVSQWYFEVWNEPNLDFWAGKPQQETYYHLYDVTARALKSVSPRLRVGGPATAQAAWITSFIDHNVKNNVPMDFVSTHVYGNDSSENVLGTNQPVSRNQMVCMAAKKVYDEVKASPRPNIPIIWSEYNASYKNETDVTDGLYMGPWMANTIRQCDGLTDMMSYWAFSDVFEEQGVVRKPLYGGYGLIAEDNLPKPAFNAFKLLHHLGDVRIALDSDTALLTKRRDGSLVMAVWNLFLPEQTGNSKTFHIDVNGLSGRTPVLVSRLDANHGSLLEAYAKMGSPAYPTRAQIAELQRAAKLPPPETAHFQNGKLTIVIPPPGLVLLQFK